MSLEALYQDLILEHQQEPQNYGELEAPDATAEAYNPMCGDRVKVFCRFDKETGNLLEQRFVGEGCSICLASASMMTEEVSGLPLTKVSQQIQGFRDFMQSKAHVEFRNEDLKALSGVSRFPVRIKCAVLPWTALQEAIESWKQSQKGADPS